MIASIASNLSSAAPNSPYYILVRPSSRKHRQVDDHCDSISKVLWSCDGSFLSIKLRSQAAVLYDSTLCSIKYVGLGRACINIDRPKLFSNPKIIPKR